MNLDSQTVPCKNEKCHVEVCYVVVHAMPILTKCIDITVTVSLKQTNIGYPHYILFGILGLCTHNLKMQKMNIHHH